MANKYYAVKEGRNIGVFGTWEECKAQVDGYSGAVYKSFKTIEEAKEYIGIKSNKNEMEHAGKETAVSYVDGSYNVVTGEYSYGAVIFFDGREIHLSEKFQDEEMAQMRNVAGEIMGSMAAMQYAIAHGIKAIKIYHDYEGIAKWCLGLWKTNKAGTKAYKDFYDEAIEKIKVTFVKVKGHSGDKYNDLADKLAKEALGI